MDQGGVGATDHLWPGSKNTIKFCLSRVTDPQWLRPPHRFCFPTLRMRPSLICCVRLFFRIHHCLEYLNISIRFYGAGSMSSLNSTRQRGAVGGGWPATTRGGGRIRETEKGRRAAGSRAAAAGGKRWCVGKWMIEGGFKWLSKKIQPSNISMSDNY